MLDFAHKRSLISIFLIFALLFSSLPLSAELTKEDMKKVVKWGTIGGVAISAAIGAATLGIGGLIVGAGIGALVATVVCDHFGIAPADQWRQVFPNFKLPFKYNRQRNSGNVGVQIPAGSIAGAPSMNSAPAQEKPMVDKIRENYQKAYQNYTEAVQKSKDSGLIKKALDAYKKAKAEFDKL